jgi:L-gulonolactone oxidase
MNDCTSHHTFENWARTLRFKPERYCEPESEEQLAAIVKDAAGRGGHVRTQGGGHSWSDFIVTDDTLVSLDKLNRGLVADIPNKRYTVQAGIRLHDLIDNLVNDGLALRNLGSITQQSIAGAICTGTHGTGIRLGNLATGVVGMKLMTGTGDVLTITENDTELLNAARVSFGALGIITQVTLDCVPIYDVENNAYFCRFDEVVDKFDTLNQENERWLMWWLVPPVGPKDNVFLVTHNNAGTPAGTLGQAEAVASGLTGPLPMDTMDLLNASLRLLRREGCQRVLHRVGRYDRELTLPLLPVFHREFEYAFPVENAAPVLRAIKRVFEEHDIAIALPVEARWVRRDDSLLSPCHGRDVCFIGVSCQANSNEVYARIEPIFKAFGGRPHWGKHFTLTRREVQEMYPDTYDTFARIRQELDPKGVFGNTLLRELFPY